MLRLSGITEIALIPDEFITPKIAFEQLTNYPLLAQVAAFLKPVQRIVKVSNDDEFKLVSQNMAGCLRRNSKFPSPLRYVLKFCGLRFRPPIRELVAR